MLKIFKLKTIIAKYIIQLKIFCKETAVGLITKANLHFRHNAKVKRITDNKSSSVTVLLQNQSNSATGSLW